MKNILLSNINRSMPVVVAVSSGADSMALLNILLKKEYPVIIAHVNHHKRRESLVEQVRLSYFAKQHNIRIEIGHFHFTRGNFHNEAHHFRQTFFEMVAKKHQTNQVILAHHLDDQLETLIMNMMKFDYITEASFIKPISYFNNIKFIRPLLNIQKKDIYSYLEKENIFFYEDSSNKNNDSFRNQIRNIILPSLYKQYPKEKWIHLLRIIIAINVHIEKKTQRLSQLSIEEINNLPLLVKRLYLRSFINKTTHYDVEISSKQLEDIVIMLQKSSSNQSFDLGNGYKLKRFYDKIDVVYSVNTNFSPVRLSMNKSFQINGQNYSIGTKKTHLLHNDEINLCYNAKGCALELRTRMTGDVIRLKQGTKKIKSLFIDEKIPLYKRDELLMIAQGSQIIYIPELKRKAFCTPNDDIIYIIKGDINE
jgi:bifunctional protein TilS/HprT